MSKADSQMAERVLVIGADARTHALVWKLQGPDREIYCTPGNPGVEQIAHILPYRLNDLEGITHWAAQAQNRPDLTIVGPEAPLAAGISDLFRAQHLQIFGPGRDAALIEGSKIFSHKLMEHAGIPHPRGWPFREGEPDSSYSNLASFLMNEQVLVNLQNKFEHLDDQSKWAGR